jgi:hypothetical protein
MWRTPKVIWDAETTQIAQQEFAEMDSAKDAAELAAETTQVAQQKFLEVHAQAGRRATACMAAPALLAFTGPTCSDPTPVQEDDVIRLVPFEVAWARAMQNGQLEGRTVRILSAATHPAATDLLAAKPIVAPAMDYLCAHAVGGCPRKPSLMAAECPGSTYSVGEGSSRCIPAPLSSLLQNWDVVRSGGGQAAKKPVTGDKLPLYLQTSLLQTGSSGGDRTAHKSGLSGSRASATKEPRAKFIGMERWNLTESPYFLGQAEIDIARHVRWGSVAQLREKRSDTKRRGKVRRGDTPSWVQSKPRRGKPMQTSDEKRLAQLRIFSAAKERRRTRASQLVQSLKHNLQQAGIGQVSVHSRMVRAEQV